ncbi:MAG: DUF4390 domain-containing protein [Pseudomonadota bacterium]
MLNIRSIQKIFWHKGVFGRSIKKLIIFITLLCVSAVFAQEPVIESMGKTPSSSIEDDFLVVKVQFDITLPSAMEDALQKGIPLYFIREFSLSRVRWYWVDDVVLASSQVWRLDYHALTRQYRLTNGLFQQNLSTLADAMRLLQKSYAWRVADRHVLPKGNFEAKVRLRFDSTRLPTPLQLGVLNQKEWSLSSEWIRWSVSL